MYKSHVESIVVAKLVAKTITTDRYGLLLFRFNIERKNNPGPVNNAIAMSAK